MNTQAFKDIDPVAHDFGAATEVADEKSAYRDDDGEIEGRVRFTWADGSAIVVHGELISWAVHRDRLDEANTVLKTWLEERDWPAFDQAAVLSNFSDDPRQDAEFYILFESEILPEALHEAPAAGDSSD